jgi:surface carbohydrate biosynthesis protein
MKKIALILDNKNRDLDGICLMAKSLTDHGHEVTIIPYNLMQFELYLDHYDFVLFNFIRKYNLPLIQEITSANIPVGISDTEGGVFSNINNFFETWPENVDKIKNLHYFFWGNDLFHKALNNSYLKPKQAYVTGCPRFDVYADFGERYPSEKKYGNEYILFNTNYPLAGPKFNTVQKELDQSKHLPSLYNRICIVREIQIKEREAIVDLIKYINLNIKIKIIIRPHPFEDAEYYAEAFADNKLIEVISEGSVKDVIKNSLLVVQRGCSTGFEARLLGKKSISPNWLPFKNMTLVDEGNIFFDKKEKLLKYISNFKHNENKSIDASTERQINSYFYKIDGYSSSRVAANINSILKKQAKHYLLSKLNIKVLIKSILFLFFGFTKISFLKIYSSEIDLWKNSDKYFTVQDLKTKCEKLGIALEISDSNNKIINTNFSRCSIKIKGIKV